MNVPKMLPRLWRNWMTLSSWVFTFKCSMPKVKENQMLVIMSALSVDEKAIGPEIVLEEDDMIATGVLPLQEAATENHIEAWTVTVGRTVTAGWTVTVDQSVGTEILTTVIATMEVVIRLLHDIVLTVHTEVMVGEV